VNLWILLWLSFGLFVIFLVGVGLLYLIG